MTSQEARLHLRYSGWASRRLLDAAKELSPDQCAQAMAVSHGSVLGTLGHIHFADRIWYQRTVDPSITMPPMTDLCTMEALTGDWQDLQRKWEAWSESLSDSDLERPVTYKMMNGTPGQTPVSQIVLHLVNHATLHRGQVVGMLRQLGHKPPATDFIYYLRELASAATTG